MTSFPPRVFTIVLNYRRSEDTIRCFESLRRGDYRNLFSIVVDNGSPPAAVSELRAGLPPVTLIETGENLGYAGGNNIGIRRAIDLDCDYVWILNPDTVVEADTLSKLIDTMSLHREIGIAGSRIVNGQDGGKTIWFDGGTVDWSRGGKTSHPNMGKPDTPHAGALKTVDYVTGASMLVRREVFDHIGLLPERYFLYFEETDFNVRAHRAGWRIAVDQRSRLSHFRRSWQGVPAPYYVYYFLRNRFLFARAFSEVSFDVVQRDVDEIVNAWRKRFARRSAATAAAFERLVVQAVADGRAGREGRGPEMLEYPWDSADA